MPTSDVKVRVGGTATLPGYVAARGGSPERVLAQAGIVPIELKNTDGWLSLDRTAALYEAAALELADPEFGFAFGSDLPLQSFGLLSYVVLNAADVETALNNLARYSTRLSVTGVAVELTVKKNIARLVFTLGAPGPDRYRQYIESIAVALCVMMKALAGPQWTPLEVTFEHSAARAGSASGAAPESGSESDSGSHFEAGPDAGTAPTTEPGAVRFLGAPARFSAGRHSIAFDAACLGQAVPGADRSLLPVIEKHVGEIEGNENDDPIVAAVRDQLVRILCDGKPDIAGVARRLAMSSRTLQRRLNDRGRTFKSIVNDTRSDLAKQYLVRSGPTVTEIAFLLGYTELSAFDRAFRRETGLPPTAWRRTNRPGP